MILFHSISILQQKGPHIKSTTHLNRSKIYIRFLQVISFDFDFDQIHARKETMDLFLDSLGQS